VPDNDVTIPDDAYVVTISTPESLTGSISVGTGDTLICTSSCTVNLLPDGVLENHGVINNCGALIIGDDFVNEGSYIDRCGGTLRLAVRPSP
jgi:hypothetical protein